MSPRYDFFCPDCSKSVELVLLMSEVGNEQRCQCGSVMQQDYRAKNIHDVGDKRYHTPIHSDALAISHDQIEEHKREFPDVKIDNECRPVFEDFKTHEAYLQKTGFQKLPQKKSLKPTFRKRYPRYAPAQEI